MTQPKLSRLELQIMETLWSSGALSIREVLHYLPKGKTFAYSTVQTMVYRLEAKGAVRRARKISNAQLFEAAVSRQSVQRRLADEFLAIFGGARPVMAHLIETGQLTMEDIRDAERLLRESEKDKP
jgi:BlaI family transcriptional regulator, penicillinase repressor